MKDNNDIIHAVIYARVSSVKQKVKGSGLNSQITRCREFAKHRNYIVTEIYKDDMTGSVIDRPAIQSMLKHLRAQNTPHVVLIDDITRLARGLETHLALRTSIAETGASLESPSIEFGDDSDSQLVENLLAAVSQHHRQKNSEQVCNRMRARLLSGYYTFFAPYGYKYERMREHGKILVRDEPMASIIQEGLEGFASGRFQTNTELARFLESHPEFPRARDGRVHLSRVKALLERLIYTGYINKPEWDVRMVKGKHEPLITLEQHAQIQKNMQTKAVAPARPDLSADFPLRGFVKCGDCDNPLTACWAKGRSKHYPYYLCHTKGCDSYGKSIKKETIETEFEEILKSLKPTEGPVKAMMSVFEEAWAQRIATRADRQNRLKRDITKCENKIEQFLERIMNSPSQSLITAYETHLLKAENQRAMLEDKLAKMSAKNLSFKRTFRTALNFLVNPCIYWQSKQFETKRAVLKLAFTEKLTYDRNKGFRTAATAHAIRLFQASDMDRLGMVGEEGLEPPTSRL